MKIHFNTLTSSDVYQAATKAGVGIERWVETGSKTHKAKYDIVLSGSSNYRVNSNSIYAKAASCDQWGIFLAELFFKDSSVKAGEAYLNQDHFNWSTGHRYTKAFTEHNHKWEYRGSVVTSSYQVHYCDCGAIRRYANKQYVKENFLDSVNA